MNQVVRKLKQVFGWLAGTRTRTLLYHSISDSPADPFSVSPDEFAAQMTWLSRSGLQVISHSYLVDAIRQGHDLSKTVVLTFDDGFSDFYDAAMPILQNFGLTATVFLPTGQIGQVSGWKGPTLGRELMCPSQIDKALEKGFEFGSHTVNHTSLTDADAEVLDEELRVSLHFMKKITGRTDIALAYPYGRGAVREQLAAGVAGYSSAYLAGGLWGNGPGSNLYALVRDPIMTSTSLARFSQLATGQSDFRRLVNDLR